MAGFVPNTWAARLLEATAGRTAITTATLYIGLALSVPDDPLTATMSNIEEVTTPGYAREAVPTFGAATTTAPVKVAVPTAFSLDAFTEDMTQAAQWAFLTDAATGTAGTLRYLFRLDVPVLGRSGEPLNVPAGTLIIE